MFVSFDDGKTWREFQQNLPITPITDIVINRGDLVLSTMGRGFWILDNITSLRDPKMVVLKDKPVLFKPTNTFRYRTSRASGDFPNYPSTSVGIDYYLPKAVDTNISLAILDENKKVIVTVVSDSTQLQSTTEEVEDMGLSMTFIYADEKLETNEGLNRFHWDLRQKGAWSEKKERSFKNGPMVPPGNYTVKLTVGNETFEQPFEILLDPRLEQEGISRDHITEQLTFQNKVIDLLSEARKFQSDLEAKIKVTKNKATKAALENVLKQVKNDEGAYPLQVLEAQISYLSYIINDSDKVIGNDMRDRYTELFEQLNDLKSKVSG
jgi:hypothetical protein